MTIWNMLCTFKFYLENDNNNVSVDLSVHSYKNKRSRLVLNNTTLLGPYRTIHSLKDHSVWAL